MSSAGGKPRVGFLGVGWIGLARLRSLAESGLVEIVGVADTNPEALTKAREVAPAARFFGAYSELLEFPLDGVVIATPSASHGKECIQALERGLSVFCQKPLAPTAGETQLVLEAAKASDRLLSVDFCYRQTKALQRVREVIASGEIGEVYAAELVFHNAYGPDKSWAQDPTLAGGGCLMDLGIHLLDSAIWVTSARSLERSSAELFKEGHPVTDPAEEVEDFALAQLLFEGGLGVSLACSWRSSFGADARINMSFFGTKGGVALSNLEGSFYDFACDRFHGSSRERLCSPPDDWGGRAIVAWADQVRQSPRYRPADELFEVATALDSLYASRRASATPRALQHGSVISLGTP